MRMRAKRRMRRRRMRNLLLEMRAPVEADEGPRHARKPNGSENPKGRQGPIEAPATVLGWTSPRWPVGLSRRHQKQTRATPAGRSAIVPTGTSRRAKMTKSCLVGFLWLFTGHPPDQRVHTRASPEPLCKKD